MDLRGIGRAAGIAAAVAGAVGVSGCGNGDPDTLIDKRDGKTYRTVIMPDGKRWMAENLNYKPRKGKSWCYDNNASNCDKYGRLYDWETAMNIDSSYNSLILDFGDVVRHQGVCPSGWFLPFRADWDSLGRAVGGVIDSFETSRCCDEYAVVWKGAGTLLKSASGWDDYEGKSGNGTNDRGFTALPGGYRSAGYDNIGRVDGTIADGAFGGVGKSSYWWTSTLYDGNTIYIKSMNYRHDRVDQDDYDPQNGVSVRCVQIDGVFKATVSSIGTGAQGGGGYFKGDTVRITAGIVPGKRLKKWTSASGGVNFADPNSATTTFIMPANDVTVTAAFEAIVIVSGTLADARDGKRYKTTAIGGQTWMAENLNYKTDGSWCYENSVDSCEKYGRLYNWNAAMKACPAGWHLPSREEWDTLSATVGGDKYAGKSLKAKRGWDNSGYKDNTDNYGFLALPGGNGQGPFFNSAGKFGYWWTATKNEQNGDAHVRAYRWMLIYSAVKDDTHTEAGLSVRCLRDAP